ncbi:MAG: hypothetical protein OSJ62_04030 [Lachnospiraceae bacterium]|nr:hypothetical protein [Lachnospiraceae bacterium]
MKERNKKILVYFLVCDRKWTSGWKRKEELRFRNRSYFRKERVIIIGEKIERKQAKEKMAWQKRKKKEQGKAIEIYWIKIVDFLSWSIYM